MHKLLLQLVTLGDANDINDMLTITKIKGPAHCCCWSNDGKYVLAAGDCGAVKLVEVGEKKRTVRCCSSARTSIVPSSRCMPALCVSKHAAQSFHLW